MKNYKLIFRILILTIQLTFLNNFSNAQWFLSSTGITGGASISSLAASGTNIFAATHGEGVYISSNNGNSWEAVNNGLTQLNVYSLGVSGSGIFAGTLDGVFKSTNNGANWTSASNGIGGTVRSFAVTGTNIYAGGGNGVFLSVNDGASWTELINGLPDLFSATCLAVSGTGVFVGHDNTGSGVPGGIYKSTNGGTNWILAVNGLINGNVRCLAASGTTLFAGTSAGVYVSTNDGNNWSQANGGLPGLLYINTIYASGSNVFVGANPPGQLYMTTNNGTNWLDKSTGFTGAQYVYAILVANNYIFAGKYHSVWRRQYAEIIGIQNISTEIPIAYSLGQNYPNPFNPTTKIEFEIPVASSVRLIIFDEKGCEIKVLSYKVSQAGKYRIEFDAGLLPSGVYFYKLEAGNFSAVRKMLLIK